MVNIAVRIAIAAVLAGAAAVAASHPGHASGSLLVTLQHVFAPDRLAVLAAVVGAPLVALYAARRKAWHRRSSRP